MNTPMTDKDGEALRDGIARIVDPGAWRALDRNPADTLGVIGRAESFAKADTILLTYGDAILDREGKVDYEVWQKDAFGDDDAMVAGSTSLKDAEHYAAVYGQDGPSWIVEVTRRRLTGASESKP